MEIDLSETYPSVDPLGFADQESYTFDFNTDFNPSLDTFPVKQEVFSPGSGEETLFDSPSSSPHPIVPEDPFSMPLVELSSHTSEGDIIFEDPIAVEPHVPAFAPVPSVLEDYSFSSQHDPSYVESRDSDSEGQTKRGRKRKAPAPAQNEKRARRRFEPGTIVSKEELHSMTSEELEEYAQCVQDSNLSAAEKNEIRKQLRLVKNRESAQASRLRKKNYIDELERRVSLLQTENNNLRQNVNNLHQENTQLKSEVVYLKGVVNNSGLSKVLTQGASFFSKLSQQQQQQQQNSAIAKTAPVLNARTTGVVLMVMLFSFGLLFNSQGLQPQGPLPGKTMVQDAQARVLNHASYKPTSEVRDVLTFLEQSEMPTHRIRQIVEKQRTMPDSTSHKVVDERRTPMKHSQQPAVEPIKLEEPAKLEEPVKFDEPAKLEERALVTDWKVNTTYLLCPEVKKLSPPPNVTPPTDPTLPMHISFLIPPDALGAGDDSAGPSRPGRGLLEVTCKVVDVTSRAEPVDTV